MIQRIQSLWLLLAGLVNAGLFYFDLYRIETNKNGLKTIESIRTAGPDYLAFLLGIVITVVPFIAIFMFKKRPTQRTLVLLNIVITIGFIAYTLMRVSNINNGTSAPVSGTYWIGSVLPVLSIIFMVMAVNGIRKDEKLVKSLDRLR